MTGAPTASPDQGRGKPMKHPRLFAEHIYELVEAGCGTGTITQLVLDRDRALRAQPSAPVSADTAELRRLADEIKVRGGECVGWTGPLATYAAKAAALLRTAADSLDAARAELRARSVGIAEKHGKLLP